MHSEVAIIQFKNSILQLKHYASVIGPGILTIAKWKLSITLIKSAAPKTDTHTHAHHTLFFFFLFQHKRAHKRFHCAALPSLCFNNGRFTKQEPSERRASGEVLSSTFTLGFVLVMASYAGNGTCLLLPRHSCCPSANVFLKTLISLTRSHTADAFLLSVTHWSCLKSAKTPCMK